MYIYISTYLPFVFLHFLHRYRSCVLRAVVYLSPSMEHPSRVMVLTSPESPNPLSKEYTVNDIGIPTLMCCRVLNQEALGSLDLSCRKGRRSNAYDYRKQSMLFRCFLTLPPCQDFVLSRHTRKPLGRRLSCGSRTLDHEAAFFSTTICYHLRCMPPSICSGAMNSNPATPSVEGTSTRNPHTARKVGWGLLSFLHPKCSSTNRMGENS